MSSRWYKSLYWRIAIGFVVGLAAMLVVQAMLFVWIVPASGPTVPARPERFAQTVATDIAEALDQNATLDLAQFVHSQFGRNALPFVVLMNDGRVVDSAGELSDQLMRVAHARLERRGPEFGPERGPGWYGRGGRGGDPAIIDRGGRGDLAIINRGGRADLVIVDRGGRSDPGAGGRGEPGPGGRADSTVGGRGEPGPGGRGEPNFGGRGEPGFGRGGRGDPFGPRLISTLILVKEQREGVVVVSPTAPFGFLLRRFAPTLTLVATGVLVLGAVLSAVVIFGPARRRLRQVEDAARRLGSGNLSARAPARGGDEVAAVALAFNAMADDLGTRAEALAASDRARRQLLADVSHELTTPVTAMRGYLETLTMPEFDLDDATQARYLGIISDETARLERIIGDLLDLARLEGGGGSLVVDDVTVEQLFARVAARHERACADAGVRIVASIEPGAGTLRGDRDRLEQALQNLAANALRYAPAGSAIELRARPDDGGIAITVSDEGPGITPEHLPHIFDRFYKAEVSRSVQRDRRAAQNGSGLGLSIVKAIVERHDGQVSIASRPGRTVFTLRFPMAAVLSTVSSSASPSVSSTVSSTVSSLAPPATVP